MVNQAKLPNRKSIRLREFDYTQNAAYFVTICAAGHRCLFGHITDGNVWLSPIGEVVNAIWQEIPSHVTDLTLDEWVVMPNHVHGIIVLPSFAAPYRPNDDLAHRPRSASLGTVVGGFKSAVSRRVAVGNLPPVQSIWQRNYYERVIRNDRELDAIRRYIVDNPMRWENDPENPRLPG